LLPLNGLTQGAEKVFKTEALSVYVNGEAITGEVRMHSDSTLVEPVTLGNLCEPNRNKAFIFCNMEWRSQRQGGLLDTFLAASEFAGNFGTITIMVTA
jgi:hypothetical protein